MPEKKVLIIEDNLFLSALLKARLEKYNILVTQAKNSEEAFDYFKNHEPDLVVLDLLLPEKSGFDILREMRNEPRLSKISVIIVSNLSKDSDIELSKELGVRDYFVKARVSLDKLVAKIKSII